ncbi:CocE/NonD family hydrolase [Streptomyces sp. GMR22]|uniref:CocE/NonD family hydrolase n=1 Tax=Streptomyces sp. GMR22 TaxID=2759524 RepID=UPI0015FA40C1|nr:CocE/NonD family hydrolase [Streptomyces sp. GMR22]
MYIDTSVAVPMRDRVTLATDLWQPAGTGPWPVLLARTPYGRTSTVHLGNPKLPDIRALVDSGYLVVVQDVRGTGESPGLMEPHRFDQSDTVDTLAWIADQDWCNGSVGMWGASYMGFPQWQAAALAPPVLRAIAPAMTSADIYRAWYSSQGAVSQGTLFNWSARMAVANLSRPRSDGPPDPRDAASVRAALEDVDTLYSLPIAHQDALLRGLPWLGEMLAHPDYDAYWKRLAALDHSSAITAPALNVTGWYDVFAREVVRSYTTMRRSGGSVSARDGQQLIIGPWGHGDGADLGVFPDRSFGPAGSVKAAAITPAHLRFYDRWLKGGVEVDPGARVRIFVMGLDRWREEDDWPLPDTRYEDYFLRSAGRANSAEGDGQLHRAPPTTTAATRTPTIRSIRSRPWAERHWASTDSPVQPIRPMWNAATTSSATPANHSRNRWRSPATSPSPCTCPRREQPAPSAATPLGLTGMAGSASTGGVLR